MRKALFLKLVFSNLTAPSVLPSYLAPNYVDSEDQPDSHEATFEELQRRDDVIKRFRHQQMIGAILENAKLSEAESITNFIDQSDVHQVSCKVSDDHFVRLIKTYPIQKSVWPIGKSIS